MKRALVLLFLLASLALPAKDKPKVQDELFGEIDSILAELSKITGWPVKRKVPAAYITRDKLRDFVTKRLKEEVKDEDVKIEQQILQMLGLIPKSFDLRKSTVDLITEQAAAFYDYNRRRLYVLETDESTLERRVTLAHELAHALADQRFSLRKFIKGGMEGDDQAVARQAVVEGQATWLMWAYMAVRGGREPSVPIELLANANMNAASGGAGFPVLAEVPMYLRESLIFPYTRGLLFQNEVHKAQGVKGFTAVFTNPPDSTRQILHPETWQKGEKPVEVKAPDAPKGYKLKAEGSMGEFDHHVLIRQYIDDVAADRVAPHWRGGTYRLYHSKKGDPVLTYASTWDTPESAEWFLIEYKAIVDKKGQTQKRIWRDGATVRSIEGLPE
ncbi:hypothetical protein F183_A32790 [Bryobacterales bacterium F-183]|nr:hypothetical protein F183_A32790 [Bryobacterales bacterium F-183]